MAYTLRTKISGAEALQTLLPETAKLLVEESVVAASATADTQRDLIESGMDPAGYPQRANAPGTRARKEAQGVVPNKPLYDTGVLADASKWRVRRMANRGARLSPPKERESALYVLRSRGYRTVLDWVPTLIIKRLEQRVQQRLDFLDRRHNA